MDTETKQRRTREEMRQIVAEFASSGMQQIEFCRSRGISRSTLDRHLRKQRSQKQASSGGNQLLAVRLTTARGNWPQNSGGLVVMLPSGHRIEVSRGFDAGTLERLLSVLERV